MSEQQRAAASFDPEDIKKPGSGGSSLWDNVDATITGFRFTKDVPEGYKLEARQGQTEKPEPIFAYIDFEIDGTAPVAERRVQERCSVGSSSGRFFDVSADGYRLIPRTDDAQLWSNNFTKLIATMVDNGLPRPIAKAGDFSKIINLKGHFKRVEDKDAGYKRTWTNKKGETKEENPRYLACTQVIALPGNNAPAATTTTSANDNFDLDSAASQYLQDVLTSRKGKALQRSQITLLVQQAASKDIEHRAAIAKRASDLDFLQNLNELGIIRFDPSEKGQPVTAVPVAA